MKIKIYKKIKTDMNSFILFINCVLISLATRTKQDSSFVSENAENRGGLSQKG